MPNFDKAYDNTKEFLDGNAEYIPATIFILFIIWGIVMQLTGNIERNHCDPYYSGDEIVSDCSDGEARAEYEL
jgi:hypothetical protein